MPRIDITQRVSIRTLGVRSPKQLGHRQGADRVKDGLTLAPLRPKDAPGSVSRVSRPTRPESRRSVSLFGLQRTGPTLFERLKEPIRITSPLTAELRGEREKKDTGLGIRLGSTSGRKSNRPLSLAAVSSQQAQLRTSFLRIDNRSRFLLVQSNARRPNIGFGIKLFSSGLNLLA